MHWVRAADQWRLFVESRPRCLVVPDAVARVVVGDEELVSRYSDDSASCSRRGARRLFGERRDEVGRVRYPIDAAKSLRYAWKADYEATNDVVYPSLVL